ncbi:MAG: restriction endonuclease subunit S [Leptolyngbya sp. Prado105]|jgi:type I restriction enzyme S subunit|nr:restriction endonuclease subunit S [Leptolyngbya sp. Prado105]
MATNLQLKPDKWSAIPLGEVATFIRGINFKPSDVTKVDTPGSVACMRTKNVQDNLDFSDIWGVPKKFIKREDQYLRYGDVLVSSANSWNLVGKCCWIPNLPWSATFGGFVSVLRADSQKVEPRYLYRWFSSGRLQTTVRSFGRQTTNISNLDINRCLALPILLPPIAEQKRIAAILDKAEELRDLRRKALGELDAIAQSIFLEMFGDPVTNPMGWERRVCKSLCSRITVGIVVQPASHYKESGVPALRSLNIKENSISLDNLVFFSQIDNETKLSKTRVKAGDVVLVRTGQPGTAAVIPDELDGVNAIDLLITTPLQNMIDSVYLCHFFNSSSGKRLVLSSQVGQIQKHLNVGILNESPVLLPPLPLQQEFARRVEAIEQLKTTHRESIAQLDTLFASLQHRAFRGEL